MKPRRVIAAFLSVSAFAVLAACSGSASTSVDSAPVVTEVTETTVAVVVDPLTGLPNQDSSTLDRPALVVKIDNHPSTRPQLGINQADIIFEENV